MPSSTSRASRAERTLRAIPSDPPESRRSGGCRASRRGPSATTSARRSPRGTWRPSSLAGSRGAASSDLRTLGCIKQLTPVGSRYCRLLEATQIRTDRRRPNEADPTDNRQPTARRPADRDHPGGDQRRPALPAAPRPGGARPDPRPAGERQRRRWRPKPAAEHAEAFAATDPEKTRSRTLVWQDPVATAPPGRR